MNSVLPPPVTPRRLFHSLSGSSRPGRAEDQEHQAKDHDRNEDANKHESERVPGGPARRGRPQPFISSRHRDALWIVQVGLELGGGLVSILRIAFQCVQEDLLDLRRNLGPALRGAIGSPLSRAFMIT